MPTFQASGRAGKITAFTATAGGATVSFAVPVKTFIIMPIGGNITFQFASTDDEWPLNDGQSFQFDLSLAYPIASNTSTIGIIKGANVTTYVAIGY